MSGQDVTRSHKWPAQKYKRRQKWGKKGAKRKVYEESQVSYFSRGATFCHSNLYSVSPSCYKTENMVSLKISEYILVSKKKT